MSWGGGDACSASFQQKKDHAGSGWGQDCRAPHGSWGGAWSNMCLHVHGKRPADPTIAMRVFDAVPPPRQYQEEGEFGEAILQCVETYQQLEAGPLAALRVAPELRSLVQRHYFDTLSRLDAALRRCCASFSAEGYSKVGHAPCRIDHTATSLLLRPCRWQCSRNHMAQSFPLPEAHYGNLLRFCVPPLMRPAAA